jgi:hypothetical protein
MKKFKMPNFAFPLFDEAQDESKKEQIAIILRFVDINGFIREKFFHIVHVKNIIALTSREREREM